MQGTTGMMPQTFPQPQAQSQQTDQGSRLQSQALHAHHTVGPDPSQLVALFNHITDERLVEEIGCVYQFNIGQGSVWYLDLKTGRGQAGKGPPTVCPPDTTISLTPEDLQALFSGEVTPFNAYMQGRLTIVGDVRLAMKLQGVIDRIRQPRGPAKTTHARDDIMIV